VTSAIVSELSNENDDGPGGRCKDPRNDNEKLSSKTTTFDSLDISSYATILPDSRWFLSERRMTISRCQNRMIKDG